MVITMAKLRMAHASTHGARKPPGPTMASYALRTPPQMAHVMPPGPKERSANDGNNNGQLRIPTPPRVAHAKPPWPKRKKERKTERW